MTNQRSIRHLIAALLAMLALFATACGSDLASDAAADEEEASATTEAVETAEEATTEAPETTAAEAEDDADAMEEEPAEEMRIVSLNPTATEMLFAIGAGDSVVAVDAFSYYPPEAPVTDLSGWEPNIEAIAGYDPTVVVTDAPLDGLEAIGIENMVLPAAVNLEDVYFQIEMLGKNTDNEEGASALIADMQTRIDAAIAESATSGVPLTFYHELDTTLYSVTSSTFVGYVYSLFGLENVADAADPDGESFGYPQLTEEYIVTADPDIIFLADTLIEEQTADLVAARPGWEGLSAVQAGNVIELNDDIVSRWGPRLVEFIETIGAAVAEIDGAAS